MRKGTNIEKPRIPRQREDSRPVELAKSTDTVFPIAQIRRICPSRVAYFDAKNTVMTRSPSRPSDPSQAQSCNQTTPCQPILDAVCPLDTIRGSKSGGR